MGGWGLAMDRGWSLAMAGWQWVATCWQRVGRSSRVGRLLVGGYWFNGSLVTRQEELQLRPITPRIHAEYIKGKRVNTHTRLIFSSSV